MSLFQEQQAPVPPHPRREPRFGLPLTGENVEAVFADCADFSRRPVLLGGDPAKEATLYYINGMVKSERVSDYVLRPIACSEALAAAAPADAFRRMTEGMPYNLSAQLRTTMDEVAFDLVAGCCVLAMPGLPEMLSLSTATEEKRSVSAPENEPGIKSARESFVESLRTNTSLVRRHLRAPELKIREHVVGRQTLTPVDVLYLDGLTNPEIVHTVEARIDAIDIDALLATGNLEEYIIDRPKAEFPLAAYTERPDRFCAGLTEGRVGVLMDGIPLGYLLPGTFPQFFKTGEDRSNNWALAAVLGVLRYLCMFFTLFLPALYIAAVTFHPEIIPVRLAFSIMAAKADVPFASVFEVLILLAAFEILQEAGLHLPPAIGQAVSILGGLVVGTAAVQAKIISPVVLIVVAVTGISGYAMPSQDFAGALRIWRFLLAAAAGVGGMFGAALGGAVLVGRLARLESFGVAYLTPFAAGTGAEEGGGSVLRRPLPEVKLREKALRPRNRRKQR